MHKQEPKFNFLSQLTAWDKANVASGPSIGEIIDHYRVSLNMEGPEALSATLFTLAGGFRDSSVVIDNPHDKIPLGFNVLFNPPTMRARPNVRDLGMTLRDEQFFQQRPAQEIMLSPEAALVKERHWIKLDAFCVLRNAHPLVVGYVALAPIMLCVIAGLLYLALEETGPITAGVMVDAIDIFGALIEEFERAVVPEEPTQSDAALSKAVEHNCRFTTAA